MAANDPRVKLTDAQTKQMEKEYQRLMELVEKQTKEQVATLRAEVAKDKNLTDDQRTLMDNILANGGFKVKLFRLTDANAIQKTNFQITYDIHDDLFDYLKRPESVLPKKLHRFLEGGSLIDPKTNKPMMTDLAPLTGKTRTGVPKYDAILDAQEKAKKGLT